MGRSCIFFRFASVGGFGVLGHSESVLTFSVVVYIASVWVDWCQL